MTTAELLRKAAAVLDDGSSPLDGWFLAENDVTLDQAYALADQLATGARFMAMAIEQPSSPAGVIMMALTAAEAIKSEKEEKQ